LGKHELRYGYGKLMIDLRPKIDQIIFDLRDCNYGLAEERLFKFLDDLNDFQNKVEQAFRNDPYEDFYD